MKPLSNSALRCMAETIVPETHLVFESAISDVGGSIAPPVSAVPSAACGFSRRVGMLVNVDVVFICMIEPIIATMSDNNRFGDIATVP